MHFLVGAKMPVPILVGVLAMWIPLSISAMTGLLCGVTVYALLKMFFDNMWVAETWDEVE